MKLGERIKKIRELKNLTQDFMAEQLRMTQSSYSKLEKRNDIQFSKLEQIAKVLGVRTEEIIKLDERVVFNLINNKSAKGIVINQISPNEKKAYEDHINTLKSEIDYLKTILNKLLKN